MFKNERASWRRSELQKNCGALTRLYGGTKYLCTRAYLQCTPIAGTVQRNGVLILYLSLCIFVFSYFQFFACLTRSYYVAHWTWSRMDGPLHLEEDLGGRGRDEAQEAGHGGGTRGARGGEVDLVARRFPRRVSRLGVPRDYTLCRKAPRGSRKS